MGLPVFFIPPGIRRKLSDEEAGMLRAIAERAHEELGGRWCLSRIIPGKTKIYEMYGVDGEEKDFLSLDVWKRDETYIASLYFQEFRIEVLGSSYFAEQRYHEFILEGRTAEEIREADVHTLTLEVPERYASPTLALLGLLLNRFFLPTPLFLYAEDVALLLEVLMATA